MFGFSKKHVKLFNIKTSHFWASNALVPVDTDKMEQ